uniref:Uncharacterized protein n=1 Tax=Rhizophora mucronata TaxID=61149 RepID=A0A2P2LUT0_RHIMU
MFQILFLEKHHHFFYLGSVFSRSLIPRWRLLFVIMPRDFML